MKKKFLLPLARQFTIVLAIFIFSIAGITLYSAYRYTQTQTSFLNESLESYSAWLAKSIWESYKSYESICYSVAYNQTVHDYLLNTEKPVSYEAYRYLEYQLNNTSLLNPYIIDIAVYGKNGTFAALTGSASNYEAFHTIDEGRFLYRSVGMATINQTLCHIVAMPIYSLDSNKSPYLGTLFLAIDINNLLDNNLSNNENTYNPNIVFMNEENSLIYGERNLYDILLEADNDNGIFHIEDTDTSIGYAVASYSIKEINHTLYILVDKSQISRQVLQISRDFLLNTGALSAIVLLLLFLLYRPHIRSLKQLTDIMKTISAGDRKSSREGIQIKQGFLGSIEINEISSAFNEMLVQTHQLNHTIFDTYTKMYELETNNRRTEIAFLRSQVNPHFLYNTLTMICGMAAEGMNDRIISVTSALSQIFRYSIKGNDMVTLREEMEIVRSYLMIQKERFGDRFSVRYDLSEEFFDYVIPKMVIQPLIENAIVHGLEKSHKPGSLLIGAGPNVELGYLAIWVFDTGVGMTEDKLNELRNSLKTSIYQKLNDTSLSLNPDAQTATGIGLLNVNSRMILYYGKGYHIFIDSEEGVGTNVQLRIPYCTQ